MQVGRAFSLFLPFVERENVFKNFKALNDRLFVAVLTGIVSNMCSNFDVGG